MERLQAIMAQQGLDALVLLGNTNVAYATGAIWPLGDSGRANFEQPVAVVVAGDQWPHLFTPVREDDRLREKMPADHLHGPVYLDFDEGVQLFATQLGELVPSGAVVGMDEWTNALRRERSVLFAAGAPKDAGRVISMAKASKTPDELSAMREGLRITEQAIADVQAEIAPGVRQTDLTAKFLRTIFEPAPTPTSSTPSGRSCPPAWRTGRGPPPVTSPARCSRPNASWPRATCCGWTSASATPGSTPTSGGPGWSDASPTRASGPSTSSGRRSWTPSST